MTRVLLRIPVGVRAWIYELLTQAIIIFGELRRRVAWSMPERRVPGRVFDVYEDERWECCDCGLVHDQVIVGREFEGTCEHERMRAPPSFHRVGHSYPIRPVAYRYRLRLGAGVPSLAVPKKS